MRKQLISGVVGLVLGSSVLASTPAFHQTCVRLIQQLDAMQPVMDEAQREQDPKARVQFHFDAWRDNHGHTHAGFRQNLLQLRQALVDQINQPDLTPNTFAPMTGDFVGR